MDDTETIDAEEFGEGLKFAVSGGEFPEEVAHNMHVTWVQYFGEDGEATFGDMAEFFEFIEEHMPDEGDKPEGDPKGDGEGEPKGDG